MLLAAPSQFDTSLHQRFQHFAIERLLDEEERRTADRADQFAVEIVDAPGHQDDVEVREARLQLRHQLEAVEIRHPHVDNRELRMKLGGDGQRLARQVRADDMMSAAQHALDGAKHPGLIVDDENA